MLERWKALIWEKKVVYGGFVILGLLILFGIAEQALALDLGSARKTRAISGASFTSSAADTLRISYAEMGTEPRYLPRAYMVWAGDGATFDVRRFFNGTAETVWMRVPEGQSLTIPAPLPHQISSVWTHVLAFKGTVTDSVLILPLD